MACLNKLATFVLTGQSKLQNKIQKHKNFLAKKMTIEMNE